MTFRTWWLKLWNPVFTYLLKKAKSDPYISYKEYNELRQIYDKAYKNERTKSTHQSNAYKF